MVGSAFAQPVVSTFDLAGVATLVTNLGNAADYQGGPSIACNPDGSVCMAAGFAAGAPFGGRGGIWSRLFNGQSLQPITDVFYPDDHTDFMDTPHAVFNGHTGQFNMLWYRRAPGTGALDFRVVNTNGTMGGLDLTRSFRVFPVSRRSLTTRTPRRRSSSPNGSRCGPARSSLATTAIRGTDQRR